MPLQVVCVCVRARVRVRVRLSLSLSLSRVHEDDSLRSIEVQTSLSLRVHGDDLLRPIEDQTFSLCVCVCEHIWALGSVSFLHVHAHRL